MPIKKIKDISSKDYCRHPEHNPPNMIVLPPGVYEHTCPSCGAKKIFTVNRVTL